MYNIDVNKLNVVKKTDMLVKRVGHSACYVPPLKTGTSEFSALGYIYVIGGRTDNQVRTKLCERYNIQSGLWESIENINQACSRSGNL